MGTRIRIGIQMKIRIRMGTSIRIRIGIKIVKRIRTRRPGIGMIFCSGLLQQ